MLQVRPFVRLQFDDASYDIYEKMSIPSDRDVHSLTNEQISREMIKERRFCTVSRSPMAGRR